MELACRVQKRLGSFFFQADFQVQGAKVGIFGPSGSGKSTLMFLLAGLLRPDGGRISLGDTVLYDSNASINLPPEQRRIGVVFQHSRLFPHLSVRKNLLIWLTVSMEIYCPLILSFCSQERGRFYDGRSC